MSRSADDYDRSVRELQFERRGQALDRMKTEEELAMEEKERLEKLEVCRDGRLAWEQGSSIYSCELFVLTGRQTSSNEGVEF